MENGWRKQTTKCLRRIYKVFWPNVVSNRELLSRSNGREISKKVLKRNWDWLGHILRRDKDDHCQVAITWAPEGKRTRKPSYRWQTRATRKHAKNCSNSTCLQRCRWQYWPIFMRLAAVASKSAKSWEIHWKFKLMKFKVIQGHQSWCQSKAHMWLAISH